MPLNGESPDEVALLIEFRIVCTLYLPVGSWWNDNQCVPATHGVDDAIGVIPFVRQYRIGFQPVQQGQRLFAVSSLSTR
jgi:hypothetical protein